MSLPEHHHHHQHTPAQDAKSDASFATVTTNEENSISGHNNADFLDNTGAATDTDTSAVVVGTPSTNNQEFLDALEDVHTRFLLNLQPETDLETPEKIFFQLEQAWWFYEDWICDPATAATNSTDDMNNNTNSTSSLPRFNHLKPFALKMFEYSPLLPDVKDFAALWSDFVQYKRKISNFGCILLNQDCTKMVLCQVWNGKSHTFPSGKINKGESGVDAAARETYEETGFDPHCRLGKTREMFLAATAAAAAAAASTTTGSGSSNNNNTTSVVPWNFPLQEQDALSYQEADGGKRRTCYVCCGVPEDFPFEPVCRKEVSKIDWYPIDNLPKPHYAVGPFMSQLKRWIKKYNNNKKRSSGGTGSGKKRKNNNNSNHKSSSSTKKDQRQNSKPRNSKERDGTMSNDNSAHNHKAAQYETPRRGGNQTPSSSRPNSRPGSRPNSRPGSSRPNSRPGSRPRSTKAERDALVESGLLDQGTSLRSAAVGWSEEEMFQVNEQLLGRKIDYDGNPHQFAEEGFFGGQDPHAFHVVGGSFLNSSSYDGTTTLPPAPPTSKLQPLFRQTTGDDDNDNDDELRPFFSDDGATPWGDVLVTARMIPSAEPVAIITHQQTPKEGHHHHQHKKSLSPAGSSHASADQDGNNQTQDQPDVIFTDSEITKRSQATKAKKLAVASRERLKVSRGGTSLPGTPTPTRPTTANPLESTTTDTMLVSFHSNNHNDHNQNNHHHDHHPMIAKLKRLRALQQKQYEEDMEYIRNWVANLPKPRPTPHFGEFRLDAAAIVNKAMQELGG